MSCNNVGAMRSDLKEEELRGVSCRGRGSSFEKEGRTTGTRVLFFKTTPVIFMWYTSIIC